MKCTSRGSCVQNTIKRMVVMFEGNLDLLWNFHLSSFSLFMFFVFRFFSFLMALFWC